ncbi:MAG TPA: MFS transporter, partial [Thermoplasmataceae archaeon]|nr:MFS transporter [Thermoplasmataceae archaeon]
MTVKGQLQPLADPNDVARENYTIFTAVTLAYTGFSTSFPFIAVFLLQVKGVPVTQVGIIYLASGVLGIAGQIVGGRLSDVLGTKTLTVIGLSVSTV